MNPASTTPLSRRDLLQVSGAAGLSLAAFGTTIVRGGALAQDAASPSAAEPRAIVGDVVDFQLGSEGNWPGHFGAVTLTMHPGFYDGGDAWYIRTDASDEQFAA